jgi:hypothetical protein
MYRHSSGQPNPTQSSPNPQFLAKPLVPVLCLPFPDSTTVTLLQVKKAHTHGGDYQERELRRWYPIYQMLFFVREALTFDVQEDRAVVRP